MQISSKKKNLTIFKIAVKEILKGSADCFAIMDLIKYPKPDDKEVEVFSMKEQRQIEQIAFHYSDKRGAWNSPLFLYRYPSWRVVRIKMGGY